MNASCVGNVFLPDVRNEFSFTNRKHHCRLCGRIMCHSSTCSSELDLICGVTSEGTSDIGSAVARNISDDTDLQMQEMHVENDSLHSSSTVAADPQMYKFLCIPFPRRADQQGVFTYWASCTFCLSIVLEKNSNEQIVGKALVCCECYRTVTL